MYLLQLDVNKTAFEDNLMKKLDGDTVSIRYLFSTLGKLPAMCTYLREAV